MQENNTEKRIIRRMKRTFHGHRIKKNKEKDWLHYVRSEKEQCLPGLFFNILKTSMSIPNY